MFAVVATRVARARRSGAARSTSAAVAVPVKMPADSPERTRPTIRRARPSAMMNAQGAERGQGEAGQQHSPAPDLVGKTAEHEQRRDHARCVRREDDRDHQLGEPEARAIQLVQRGGQRRAEHRDRERERNRRQAGPAPQRQLRCARRRVSRSSDIDVLMRHMPTMMRAGGGVVVRPRDRLRATTGGTPARVQRQAPNLRRRPGRPRVSGPPVALIFRLRPRAYPALRRADDLEVLAHEDGELAGRRGDHS
jgi:hypothetical protein